MGECGSENCAGCYEVEPGKKIHPPRTGERWDRWREFWAKMAADKEAKEAKEKAEAKERKKK